MKKPFVFFIAALILVFPALVSNANAYAWSSEELGEASISGSYYKGIGQYQTNTLLLGADCIIYQGATATGSMYVYGRATLSDYVTGYIYWYQKGNLAGGGEVGGDFSMYVHVKFQVFDITANVLAAEKLLIDEHGVYSDEGTWHDDSMDYIPLFEGHYYKFSLWAEVHAHAYGFGAAIADFGGIYTWSDSRIQWGEINMPNTVPAHALSIGYYSTYPPSREGTTDPAIGTHVYEEGTAVSVQAIPNAGYVFSYWLLDGTLCRSNPIVVTMNARHSLQVYFRPVGGGGGGHKK